MSEIDSSQGHVELERSVASILVGVRHRRDLGDLHPLMASIQRLGLLQPVTITPDGVLVCGRRRLEAVRQLGWSTLRVWVRGGLSDDLTSLLAQRDENALRKPLTPVEAAALYRELKKLMAEDAARRQRTTRFSTVPHRQGAQGCEGAAEGSDGGPDSGPPSGPGKAARQAALLVTQTASHTRLEQICEMEQIAADPDRPTAVRAVAEDELALIRAGGAVDPSYQRLKAAVRTAARVTGEDESREGDDLGDFDELAAEAVATSTAERAKRVRENRLKRIAEAERAYRSARSFALTWADLDGWSQHYDAEQIARQLQDDDWALFLRVLDETRSFAESVAKVRAQLST